MLLLLAWLPLALAADPTEQNLAWDLTVDGQVVGTRTLTVKYTATPEGTVRRIVESYAEVNEAFQFQQRMTGMAGLLPASFHAVTFADGESREVQARVQQEGWRVAVSEKGKSKTYDLPDSRIDLSTVDLVDPATTVPISRYETARLLNAETAEILEGTVSRLGPSDLIIEGQQVHVEEYMWEPAGKPASYYYYTADGFLVKYETTMAGRKVTAMLQSPPPDGIDDAPVPMDGGLIQEVEL
jgi:hypothetical protein